MGWEKQTRHFGWGGVGAVNRESEGSPPLVDSRLTPWFSKFKYKHSYGELDLENVLPTEGKGGQYCLQQYNHNPLMWCHDFGEELLAPGPCSLCSYLSLFVVLLQKCENGIINLKY